VVATDKPAYKVVGTRPVRPDGADKVTGRAEYGADYHAPGLLYGRVLRSPHAHANIKHIDTSKAKALDGVRAVITNADFPQPGGGALEMGEAGPVSARWVLDNVLAGEKALYRGHAVAAVAATDPHIAEDALDLIEVEYEVLEPVLEVIEAMDPNAPILHAALRTEEVAAAFGPGETTGTEPTNVAKRILFEAGDIAQGFADADVVVEREFRTSMAHQGYIEPHNASAFYNTDGHLTVWTSTQGSFGIREQTATLMGMPLSHVTCVPMEIGGGFGGKISVYLEPLAAMLSKLTRRPVKLQMTRQAVLEASGPTSGTVVRAKIGAKNDGTITAADVWLAFEAGGYPGSPFGAGAMCALGPYDLANARVEGFDVVVNKPKVAAYRAPGAPATEFAVESVVDEIAERLEMDPMDLRAKNAAKEGTRRVDGAVFGVIGNEEVIEVVKNSDHYRSELQGEHRGRGVAMGFWFNAGMESSAYANVNPDGTVSLVLGSVDIGGQRAAQAMQLAETLGVGYDDVKPHVVDTDSVGYTNVTGGSRTSFATGWATYEAGMDIRRQMEERAAQIWEVDRDQVAYGDDGVIRGPAADQALTFKELAEQLPTTGGMIQGQADVSPMTAGPAFAGHIVDVEVDPETGKVDVLRYTAVQDVGTAIHPAYVEGQIQGGVGQGVGMALTEEYFYSEDGTMLNSSLLDYRMPTALDLPMIETVLVEVPNPGHPYGVRGVGEVPIIPPLAAVANAVSEAVGRRLTTLPLSPRQILEETVLED
jgi:CO/xanthine dehydrogenase Mo-binding subunit